VCVCVCVCVCMCVCVCVCVCVYVPASASNDEGDKTRVVAEMSRRASAQKINDSSSARSSLEFAITSKWVHACVYKRACCRSESGSLFPYTLASDANVS
jgi:hypothetical protein